MYCVCPWRLNGHSQARKADRNQLSSNLRRVNIVDVLRSSQLLHVPSLSLDARTLPWFALLEWVQLCCTWVVSRILARLVERKCYSVETVDSLRPLFKAIVYLRSWVRNSVNISTLLAKSGLEMPEIWHRARFCCWHSTCNTFSSSRFCISCVFARINSESIEWRQGHLASWSRFSHGCWPKTLTPRGPVL